MNELAIIGLSFDLYIRYPMYRINFHLYSQARSMVTVSDNGDVRLELVAWQVKLLYKSVRVNLGRRREFLVILEFDSSTTSSSNASSLNHLTDGLGLPEKKNKQNLITIT